MARIPKELPVRINFAKPIFIIELPVAYSDYEVENVNNKVTKTLLDDYHVIVFRNQSEDFKFKLFSDKDITEIEINELKELIKTP